MEKAPQTKPSGGLQPAQVWRESFIDEVRPAVLAGCTSNQKLAEYFGVSATTIANWRKKHISFDVQIQHANVALLSEVSRQMLLSATEHQVIEEKVLSDGTIVQYQKTLPGSVRAQEALARVLGDSIFDEGNNPWNPKAKVEHSGHVDSGLSDILKIIAEEQENASPLPSEQ